MLFDLRGRGRRRTVQVIYAGLAILIGAGLILFGVGAGIGGGGLLNSLTGNEGSSSASFSAQIEKYKKLAHQQPSDAYAWEQLALAQLHEAGGEAYVTRTGPTNKGKELYAQIVGSWNSYLATNPPKPNPTLALEMVSIFGEEGLNQPAEAVKALQIVIPAKSTSTPQYQASLYEALAKNAYKANNPRIGDLASEKAVSLVPAAQRKQVKTALAELKAHPGGHEYTTTTNGKTYNVKPNGSGTLTGTPAKTTPSPAGGSTTTTTTTK